MNKSILTIAGIALLAVPSVQAQGRNGAGRQTNSQAFASRQALYSRHAGYNRSTAFFHGNRYHHRGRGRYYYLGGIPYYYPFFDYGFGYPYYYGSGFGYGFSTPDYGGFGSDFDPGYGYYGAPRYDARLDERIAPGDAPAGGQSLPSAVQGQLAKRGYYKGKVDGELGDGSRSALRRFQKDNKLKETGRIDEPTLRALGFSDRR
jgi:hypothetical protein